MLKKWINFLFLLGFGLALYFLDTRYPDVSFQKGYVTAFAAVICYLIFKLLFEELVIKKVKTAKTRYSLRKATSLFFVVFLVIVILRIWLPNAQALLVSYGLIAAGVAISLQDFFKNLVGGIIIFINGPYKVGDRIEINGKFGDVIDVDMLYTSLLEIGGWVAGDQATGRIVSVPNGFILSHSVDNYTKDHSFIWDEITLPITYGSNWQKAVKIIKEIIAKETKEITSEAEKEFSSHERKYYFSKRNVDPDVFLTPTDNWITFNIRYITKVRERRILNNKLIKLILEAIQASKDINIASSTLSIVGLPSVSITKDKS